MNGKSKCKILKEIRRQIAENNDIEFVTSECKYQGDCLGTCPKCEAEVRYLEAEILKRKQLGKNVAVAGLAAALVATSIGCADKSLNTESSDFINTLSSDANSEDTVTDTVGEVVEILQGDVAVEESVIIDPFSSEDPLIQGDIDFTPTPSMNYFLTLPESLYFNYISQFHREEVRSAWKSKLANTGSTNHDYYMIFDNTTKRLDIEYDNENKLVSVEVIENSVSSIVSSIYSNSELSIGGAAPYEPEEEIELVFHNQPDFEYVFTIPSQRQRLTYVAHYTRDEIRESWQEFYYETSIVYGYYKADVYRNPETDTFFIVEIRDDDTVRSAFAGTPEYYKAIKYTKESSESQSSDE